MQKETKERIASVKCKLKGYENNKKKTNQTKNVHTKMVKQQTNKVSYDDKFTKCSTTTKTS